MSDVVVPQPTDGGSFDIWGPMEQAQNHLAIGCNTRKLYLDGVTLKLSAGMIGLYNGSQYYNISNSAARTISIAALTASLWAKLELSVVAGVVTTTISSILGANNPAVLPVSFTGSFDPTKGGYYETATKRIVGLVWINAAGAVEGIVNTIGGIDGYTGYGTSNDALDIIYQFQYINYSFAQPDINSEYAFTKNANYTIPAYSQYKGGEYSKIIRILMTAGANGTIITLGAVADNIGRIIKINRVDDGTGCTTIYPPLGVTISDMAYVFLFEKNGYVELYCDGATYRIIHGSLTLQTGGINTADWTNRELGDAVIPYDNAAGTALVIGEKVTNGTTPANTGIIVAKTATTITLKKSTGTGIHADNNVLTGSMGGGTAEVNIPGSTSKNADSNFYNPYSNFYKVTITAWISTNTTFSRTNAQKILENFYDASNLAGMGIIDIDNNNFKVQTGSAGVVSMAENGTPAARQTDDYSYNIIMMITF
jgi:hypothetical protein